MRTHFKCGVCGKLTAGKVPKNGDGTLIFPRRHRVKGILCKGIFIAAEWIDVDNQDPNPRREGPGGSGSILRESVEAGVQEPAEGGQDGYPKGPHGSVRAVKEECPR